ncbi:hypothetical protein CSW20_07850 [Thermus scotoductus]|nr:hypothetical protein CSW20_07850 [Thermus scotoductus]
MGEGGEVGLEGGLGGQVAFGEVLALEEQKDGEGQELGQGGFLVLLLWGELEALGLQGLQFVIYPDVGSHQKGFCVKIVGQPKATFWGCSRSCRMAPPLFSHPEGLGQVAHEGIKWGTMGARCASWGGGSTGAGTGRSSWRGA